MDSAFKTPLLDVFRRGEAPVELRLQAARGVLAPRAHEQLELLMLLVKDADAEVVAAAGIEAVDDPSNADERFDRVRIRQALAEAAWLDPEALSDSARNLADADAALDWAAGREWLENVRREGLGLTYRPAAPRAIALRVLARIVRELGGEEARGSSLARAFESLVAGRPASIGELVGRPGPDGWSFTPAPRRRNRR